ncbi:hypothetical protein JIG36_01530 [Actinoplanes sp. LDG1-06]|uniref:Effector-associated domain-containing protein n=1 Tax=Paractinoplanes ovalisporus TaxID=2810368 RepID=A0ABS2A327_9ACTN|nr:effector-associated domain EAD1-containing protein [Actinoplanes ovalisporus]MBM2614236.1 hypothetical protein [Actinoplanes ovalisporus]
MPRRTADALLTGDHGGAEISGRTTRELTGPQLQSLEAAILDAYRTLDALERLLVYSLDRQLSHHADLHSPLPMVVFRLLGAARGEGWLAALIEAALVDRAGNVALSRWAAECWSGDPAVPQPAPPADQQVLDSAFFDLEPLKRQVIKAKSRATIPVLGFGLHDVDQLVVNKLCAWLPHCLGETERKDWLHLRPDRGAVDLRLKQVLRYLPDLELVNVVCPILTEGATGAAVAAFWDGIGEHFGAHEYRFVALFVGPVHPDGVEVLPQAAADETDLTLWAQQIVSHRGWPPMLAESWTSLIVEQCSTGTGLDMRMLFEAMDSSIRDVRQSPAQFRRQLEEVGSRADPSPR